MGTNLALLNEIQAIVRQFFADDDNRNAYQSLLNTVQDACDSVQKSLGPTVVQRSYGRSLKQGGRPFKSERKIAAALSLLAAGERRVEAVGDVIGVTMVVLYPDQIALVADTLVATLAPKAIRVAEPKPMTKGGYYATHLNFTSQREEDRGLRCEVQIKTVLHDAWGTKTHDLTYKPKGPFDKRFRTMMQVFGDALQAIDKQSEVLRELIEERWHLEHKWQHAARLELLQSLHNWDMVSDAARILQSELTTGIEALRRLPADDVRLTDVYSRLYALEKTSLREAHLLRAYLAIERNRPDELGRATKVAKTFLDECVAGRAQALRPDEIWSIPLVLQACGNIEESVTAGEKLLTHFTSDRELAIVKINLANHLLELAYLMPYPAELERNAARERIQALLDEARAPLGDDPTPFYDTEGMILVTFSDDPRDVRKGLELISRGNQNVPDDDRDVAKAFFDLHSAIGWRRLLTTDAKNWS